MRRTPRPHVRRLALAATLLLAGCLDLDQSPLAPEAASEGFTPISLSIITRNGGDVHFADGDVPTRFTAVNEWETVVGVLRGDLFGDGVQTYGVMFLGGCGCPLVYLSGRVPLAVNDFEWSGGTRRISGLDLPMITDYFGDEYDVILPPGTTRGAVQSLGSGDYPFAVGWASNGGPTTAVLWTYDSGDNEYEPTVLPDLGGTSSAAYGINSNSFLIVGTAEDGGEMRAVTWDFFPPHTINDLGIAGVARDVNDLADIVGQNAAGGGFYHRPNGTVILVDNGSFPPGVTTSLAAVNNLGVATGWFENLGHRRAITFTPDAFTPMVVHSTPNDADVEGTDINDAGTMPLHWVAANPVPLMTVDWRMLRDDDNDGVSNGNDNCKDVFNPGQEDDDFDDRGNACEEDQPPVITSATVSATTQVEGQGLRLKATAFDHLKRPLTYSWTVTNLGTSEVTNLPGQRPFMVFPDNGDYDAVVTVDNGAGGITNSGPIPVTVTNRLPKVTYLLTPGAAGTETSLDLNVEELVEDGPFQVNVDWGDATTPTNETCGSAGDMVCGTTVTHTYAVGGTYSALIKVTDKDLGQRRTRISVVIP